MASKRSYGKKKGISQAKAKAILAAAILVVAIVAIVWQGGGVSEVVEGLSSGDIVGYVLDGKAAKTSSEGAGTEYGPVGSYEPTDWDQSASANYYRLAGTAVITHPDMEAGDVAYGELDSLGRATWACGFITTDMYEAELAEEREQNLPDPAGYAGNNAEADFLLYTGDTVHTWFYNRSHLLADSLCGAAALENLVTGTRMQNVGTNNQGGSGYGGMAYTEELSRQFLAAALEAGDDDATLYYCATPIYVGDELLPRSVYVDVKSYGGTGDPIDLHVEVFNVAGDCATGGSFSIDYSTGAWSVVG